MVFLLVGDRADAIRRTGVTRHSSGAGYAPSVSWTIACDALEKRLAEEAALRRD
jgi:hypothetical protein